ncbi:MAG: nicotinate-nucleotide adenylyltransferase [Elusimicrobiota bacterium]
MALRLALFGGSFDPVHNGHLALARAARRELKLDRVYFVPAKIQPHKKDKIMAPAALRLELLRLAVGRERGFLVSDWELRRPGVSYTENTLRAFRRRFPRAQWHLLVGGDALKNFTAWRNWRGLLAGARLTAARRRGLSSGRLPRELRGRVLFLKARPPRVSSSEIRRRAAAGRSLAGLVPPAVAARIRRRGLCRP